MVLAGPLLPGVTSPLAVTVADGVKLPGVVGTTCTGMVMVLPTGRSPGLQVITWPEMLHPAA